MNTQKHRENIENHLRDDTKMVPVAVAFARSIVSELGKIPKCDCRIVETGIVDSISFCPLHAAAPDLLEACRRAEKLIRIARQYFPKSVQNSDRFDLENTNATVTAAIQRAGGVS